MKNHIVKRMYVRVPPKWWVVPDFISLHTITDYDRYHLFEGYCITVLDCKKSGRHYNKLLIDGDYHQFLSWMGYSKWWEYYKLERNIFKRFLFGKWKVR